MDRRRKGEENPTIECACGCGEKLKKYSKEGKIRKCLRGHKIATTTAKYFEAAKKRFWAKVDKRGKNECWEWLSVTSHDGYGRIWFHKRFMGAHRFSWMIHNNSEPGQLCVCHRCDNPICVNPNHLFLGTSTDNMQDRISKTGWQKTSVKLSAEEVVDIRHRYEKETISSRKLGKEYGVSKTQILRIIKGSSRRHVRNGIDYGYGFITNEKRSTI